MSSRKAPEAMWTRLCQPFTSKMRKSSPSRPPESPPIEVSNLDSARKPRTPTSRRVAPTIRQYHWAVERPRREPAWLGATREAPPGAVDMRFLSYGWCCGSVPAPRWSVRRPPNRMPAAVRGKQAITQKLAGPTARHGSRSIAELSPFRAWCLTRLRGGMSWLAVVGLRRAAESDAGYGEHGDQQRDRYRAHPRLREPSHVVDLQPGL